MGEERKLTVMGVRVSADIRLGEIIMSLGVIGGGMLWWGDWNSQFALVKAAQAAQAAQAVETNTRMEGNIREIKNDVKETKDSIHGLERRMDRARM